jgi:hypothetical protein
VCCRMSSSDKKFTLRTSHIPRLMYNYLDNRGQCYVTYLTCLVKADAAMQQVNHHWNCVVD